MKVSEFTFLLEKLDSPEKVDSENIPEILFTYKGKVYDSRLFCLTPEGNIVIALKDTKKDIDEI